MAEVASSDEDRLTDLQRYLPILRQTAPCVITAVLCSLICGNQGLFLTVYIAVSVPFLLSAMNNNQVSKEDVKNAVAKFLVDPAKRIMAVFTTSDEENLSVLQQYLPILRQVAPCVMMTILSSLICGNQGVFLLVCIAVLVPFLVSSVNTNHISNGDVAKGISFGIFQITISKTCDKRYSNNHSTNCTTGLLNRKKCTEGVSKTQSLIRRRKQRDVCLTEVETEYEEDDEDSGTNNSDISPKQYRYRMFTKKIRTQTNCLSTEGILPNKNPNRRQYKMFTQKYPYYTDGAYSSYSENESIHSNTIESVEFGKEPGSTSCQNYAFPTTISRDQCLSEQDEPNVSEGKDKNEEELEESADHVNCLCSITSRKTSPENHREIFSQGYQSETEQTLLLKYRVEVCPARNTKNKHHEKNDMKINIICGMTENGINDTEVLINERDYAEQPDKVLDLQLVRSKIILTNHCMLLLYKYQFAKHLDATSLREWIDFIPNNLIELAPGDWSFVFEDTGARSPVVMNFSLDTNKSKLKNREIMPEIQRLILEQVVHDKNTAEAQYNPTLTAELRLLRQRKDEIGNLIQALQESLKDLEMLELKYVLHCFEILTKAGMIYGKLNAAYNAKRHLRNKKLFAHTRSDIGLTITLVGSGRNNLVNNLEKAYQGQRRKKIALTVDSSTVFSTFERIKLDEMPDGSFKSLKSLIGEINFRFSDKYLGMTRFIAPLAFRKSQERSGEKQEKLLNFNVQVNAELQLNLTYISPSDDQPRVEQIGAVESIEGGNVDDVSKLLSDMHFSVGIVALREFQQNRECGKAPRMYEYDPRIFIDALRQARIPVEILSTSQNEDLLRYRLHFPTGCRMVITVPMNRPNSKELATSKG